MQKDLSFDTNPLVILISMPHHTPAALLPVRLILQPHALVRGRGWGRGDRGPAQVLSRFRAREMRRGFPLTMTVDDAARVLSAHGMDPATTPFKMLCGVDLKTRSCFHAGFPWRCHVVCRNRTSRCKGGNGRSHAGSFKSTSSHLTGTLRCTSFCGTARVGSAAKKAQERLYREYLPSSAMVDPCFNGSCTHIRSTDTYDADNCVSYGGRDTSCVDLETFMLATPSSHC